MSLPPIEPLQFVSMGVTFVTAVVIGVLAHRSPKGDFEFISQWPALLLFIISGALAQAEAAAAAVLPYSSGCYELEFLDVECPEPSPPPAVGLGDVVWVLVGNTFWSMLLDAPFALVGGWIGVQVGKATESAPPLPPVAPVADPPPRTPPPPDERPKPARRRRRPRPKADPPSD